MIPLSVFLLACAAVYLGAIEAAFSALMRLSLRLLAERSDRPGALGEYLDDPLLLFVPVRLLLGLVTGAATVLLARGIGLYEAAHARRRVLLSVAFVRRSVRAAACRSRLLGGDPERVLEVLLPTFAPIARAARPDDANWIARAASPRRKARPAAAHARRGGRGGERGGARPTSTPPRGRASSKARSAGCCRASSTSATRWSARS